VSYNTKTTREIIFDEHMGNGNGSCE